MHIWMSSLRDLLRGEVRSGLPRRSLVAASAVGGDWSRHARRADPSPTPMRSELPLRLYLFGPLRAFIDSEVAIDEHFTRRKAKALLALLYLERGRYIPKDELIERLWPNVDEMSADSGRLKQTVLVLRRALEGGSSRRTGWQYIIERGGTYCFNTQATYRCDLEEYEQELALAQSDRQRGDADGALAHFQRAFALRRSELLPEFRYEDWAVGHISAEREEYLQALEDAARLHGARGDAGGSVELLRRATREDPLRESSALQLMDWLWRKGEPAEALRVYVRLRDGLASRLQLEPDPKITALYNAIRRDRNMGGQHGAGLSAVS